MAQEEAELLFLSLKSEKKTIRVNGKLLRNCGFV